MVQWTIRPFKLIQIDKNFTLRHGQSLFQWRAEAQTVSFNVIFGKKPLHD